MGTYTVAFDLVSPSEWAAERMEQGKPHAVKRGFGVKAAPTVVVAAGSTLHALSATGAERAGFPATLGGPVVQDPAAGDVHVTGLAFRAPLTLPVVFA